MAGDGHSSVRRASGTDDARSAGQLLDRFNREYGYPTPGPDQLTSRILELDGPDFAVFLAGGPEGDVGVAVIRFRPALWANAPEAYIAELFVLPGHRRSGLGSALMEAMLGLARERDCTGIELATDEEDHDAHRLYRRFGFSNLTDPGAPEGKQERMFVYEREL
jgi:GNAT superfamily N-acetyltransferase